MPCQACINRQRRIVDKLCKKPDSWLCRKARERLEKMTKKEPESEHQPRV